MNTFADSTSLLDQVVNAFISGAGAEVSRRVHGEMEPELTHLSNNKLNAFLLNFKRIRIHGKEYRLFWRLRII
jgi:hypothetical protein